MSAAICYPCTYLQRENINGSIHSSIRISIATAAATALVAGYIFPDM